MKTLKSFLIAAATGLFITSCGGNSNSNPLDNAVYYPVKLEKNGKWGMMDSKGKTLFEDEFEYGPTVPCEGVFIVYGSDGLNIYSAKEKPQLLIENVADAGYANEGLIVFSKNDSEIQVADTKGNVKFALPGFRQSDIAFHEGLLAVYDEDGNAGFVNNKGEVVIKPQFSGVTPFSDGVALARTTNNDLSMNFVIIDKSGKIVAKIKDSIHPQREFHHDVALAYEDSEDGRRAGFINKKGEFSKLPEKVRFVDYYDDKVVVFSDGQYWGLMTRDGEITARAKYLSIQPMNDPSKFLAHKNDKYIVIDRNGEELEQIDYNRVAVVKGKGFQLAARDGGMSILLDEKGNPVKNAEFVEMSNDLVKSYHICSHK